MAKECPNCGCDLEPTFPYYLPCPECGQVELRMNKGQDTWRAGQLAAHLAALPPDLPVWVSVDDKRGGIETILSIQEVYEGDPSWDDPDMVYIFATE